MCGIVGMAGNGVIKEDHDAFRFLLQASIVRGQDATGIFQGNFGYKKPTWLIEKKLLNPIQFFNWVAGASGNKEILRSTLNNIYIGHARWSTKGDEIITNAHPFRVGDIVGVHNGTLVESRYQDKVLSDSYLAYRDIAQRGIKAVVSELDDWNAYVFNFFNMKEERIYFIRNKERPLHVCMNIKRRVLYWASEAGMLAWGLDRLDIKHTDIVRFGEHKIYSIGIDEIDNSKANIPFKGEDYTVPKWVSSHNSKGAYANKEWWDSIFGPKASGMDEDNIPWDDEPGNEDPNEMPQTSIIANPFKMKIPDSPKKSSQGAVFHVDDTTSSASANSNVIPLNQIKKLDGKIKHVHCTVCDEEMSLPEQYYCKSKITVKGETVYECSECESLRISTHAEMKNSVH